MSEVLFRVAFADLFLEQLDLIEAFLLNADAPATFHALQEDLLTTVIPNLARFPKIGRRYLPKLPSSNEAMRIVSSLRPGDAERLRVYLHGEYLMLYSLGQTEVHLLAIRHHRQASFDFAGL